MSMLFFGCLGQDGCQTECPEGFEQLENCTCVAIDTSTTLKEGENVTLKEWNFLVKSISEDAEYDNGSCIISEEQIKFKATNGNESKIFTLIEQGKEVLSDDLVLFIEDISQIFNVEKKGCEVEDKEVKLNVQSSDVSLRKVTVPVKGKTTLSTGVDIEVPSIGISAEFVNSFSNLNIYDSGEEKELEDDIVIKVKSITEDITIGDMAEVTITKDEGEQASLTGDYTIRILDITQDIEAPDTDTLTDIYGEGEDVTLEENTNILINAITIITTNCTDNCTVVNELVTLGVRPEGASLQNYELEEGDSVFVSNRVRVQVLTINADVECVEEVCVSTNKNVDLRITTYAKECTIVNREANLELLFPDLSTETFTSGYGEEKVFISEERVKVNKITEDMVDSVNGTCEISNEEVQLILNLPSSDCAVSNVQITIEVEDGQQDYNFILNTENNKTTGRKDNILVYVDSVDIDVEYDDDEEKCTLLDEKVSLKVEVEAACFAIKEDATLKYGKSVSDVLVGDSITVDKIEVELKDVTADIELNNDEDGCDVSNKKAELKIMEPISEDFTFEKGESEDFGDLELGVNTVTFKTIETDEKCSISDKEAELFFEEDGSKTTRTIEEGETFNIGQYTINVLEINGKTSDESLYTCTITDRQAKIKLVNIPVPTNEETDTEGNESIEETDTLANETETVNATATNETE